MSRDWKRYLSAARADAGRAIIEQGKRLDEAHQNLPKKRYLDLLAKLCITPREARTLVVIGSRLYSSLKKCPDTRFPYRIRLLSLLADLSTETLFAAASSGMIHPAMTENEVRELRGSVRESIPQVIRPTDNWNFSSLYWPRIDGWEGHGYIPGDLYANCLWYYARDGDTVVDPMAGSGMLLKVWEDRNKWSNGSIDDLKIVLSDLRPRGPYVNHIQECDLLESVPVARADYIIVDPPYCGLVSGQYSDFRSDLANMLPPDWISAMNVIAKRFSCVQPDDGRCTVIVPNSRFIATGERILFPEIVRHVFEEAGYYLFDVAYASRRTQQKQGRRMGILNNKARREKVPLADIAEVLTFVKSGSPPFNRVYAASEVGQQ